MTVHLKAGESYSLTTGRVVRVPGPKIHKTHRPAGTVRGNDLRALQHVFSRY